MRRGEQIALLVAFCLAGTIMAAAFVAPAYQTVSADSSGVVTHGSDTLVGVNGTGGALVAAIPLAASIMTTIALWSRGQRHAAGPIAWTLTGLLAAFNLAAIASIGLAILPITGCLIYACAVHGHQQTAPRRRQPSQ